MSARTVRRTLARALGRGVALWLALGVCLGLGGCERLPFHAPEPAGRLPSLKAPARVELAPGPTAQPATLRPNGQGVVDGDTLRLVGFDQSVRLLYLDCEEALYGADLEAAERDWQAYVRQKTAGADADPAYGTPTGNLAKGFAREFFAGVEQVYVQYPSPAQTRDYFGRHLAYVWVERPAKGWQLYNLEAVRAGMSPYATKFGFSQDWHQAFEQAQAQARARGVGIWAPTGQHYGDYTARLAYWQERARQIEGLRQRLRTSQVDWIDASSDVAIARLRDQMGQRVHLFGAVGRFSPRGRPPRLYLSHRHRMDIAVVASEGLDMTRLGVDPSKEQFVYVDGMVTLWRGNPQIQLDAQSRLESGRAAAMDRP